jgi:SulP family sulfate permease
MLQVQDRDLADGTRVYEVKGEVFFASATQFGNSFDFLHAPAKVVIDLRHAHFWDLSAVGALDRVVLKLRAHGAQVEVTGLNEASETLVERVGRHRDVAAVAGAGH